MIATPGPAAKLATARMLDSDRQLLAGRADGQRCRPSVLKANRASGA
jgi:hypothetical protein